jgi:phenylpyruvate tautomerase PptA (4-oxalocrotonate tautomerase family)
MARYLIHIPRDSLSDDRKARVAAAVTKAHSEITCEDADQVAVAITEIDAGCFFMGGSLIECDRIFVHGYVADQVASSDRRRALIDRLSADVTEAADFDPDSTWVTISRQ